jgi:hypothetical protein
MNNNGGAVSGSFTNGALPSGSTANVRWEVTNVNTGSGTFNLTVRAGNDNNAQKNYIESWPNLSLDPNLPNFISRVIGDFKPVFRIDADNNYYVDYLEPTYFWNRPISFLNTPGIMKSHNTPVNNTYFRLQRLHDIYHINCSSTTVGGVVKWGEYGYVQGGTPPTMGLAYNSTYYSNNNFFVSLGGSTLPEIYGPTVPSEVPLNIIDPANTNYGR